MTEWPEIIKIIQNYGQYVTKFQNNSHGLKFEEKHSDEKFPEDRIYEF